MTTKESGGGEWLACKSALESVGISCGPRRHSARDVLARPIPTRVHRGHSWYLLGLLLSWYLLGTCLALAWYLPGTYLVYYLPGTYLALTTYLVSSKW